MRGKHRTTLVAYDGSATAKAAVEYAARRLEPNGRLVVAHVVVPPAEYFDELYDEWRQRPRELGEALLRDVKDALGDVAAELRVAEGPPAHTLVELAREAGADEIVIGSRGLGASRAVLGSVSHALLHETDRPVVVLTQRAAEREARPGYRRRGCRRSPPNRGLRRVIHRARGARVRAAPRSCHGCVRVGQRATRARRAQAAWARRRRRRRRRVRSAQWTVCRGSGTRRSRPRRRCDRGRLARAWTSSRAAR